MGAPQLQLTIKPEEFFRERIAQAVQNQKVSLDHDLEYYLVNLLCEFIAPGKLETLSGELDALETPLALMLKEALESPPAHQLRIFKYLGDTSLYLAGFFQDYFNRKAFDIGYYITLGSSAYSNASSLMRDVHGDQHFTKMYGNLGERFRDLVEVVAEVSESQDVSRDIDILAIYDRWNRTNSERLRKHLIKAGILPIPSLTRDRQ